MAQHSQSISALKKQLARVKSEIDRLEQALNNHDPSLPPAVTADSIRNIILARRRREEVLGASLFADPGWDLLLALYSVHLADGRASIRDLSRLTGVPFTTLLAWVSKFERLGLARKDPDPQYGNRTSVDLTSEGRAAMDRYFDHRTVAESPI